MFAVHRILHSQTEMSRGKGFDITRVPREK
jgi:hypothetical protein